MWFSKTAFDIINNLKILLLLVIQEPVLSIFYIERLFIDTAKAIRSVLAINI